MLVYPNIGKKEKRMKEEGDKALQLHFLSYSNFGKEV
jgi:hypothetical protein